MPFLSLVELVVRLISVTVTCHLLTGHVLSYASLGEAVVCQRHSALTHTQAGQPGAPWAARYSLALPGHPPALHVTAQNNTGFNQHKRQDAVQRHGEHATREAAAGPHGAQFAAESV